MSILNLIKRFKAQETPSPEVLLNMAGMAERNAARLEAVKKEMGEKWILHPVHTKSKLNEPRPV